MKIKACINETEGFVCFVTDWQASNCKYIDAQSTYYSID